MNKKFHKFVSMVLIVAAVLIAAWIFLTACVYFGVQTFAAELPSITEPCGFTVEQLESKLKHDLKPYAQEFLNAEEDYGINACFIASVAALESGWGRFMHVDNNIFGFGQKKFDSVEHSIDYVSWFLYKNYIREDGRYYRGGTIADIGTVYCPDGGEWVELVSGIYWRLCHEQ